MYGAAKKVREYFEKFITAGDIEVLGIEISTSTGFKPVNKNKVAKVLYDMRSDFVS